MATRKQSDQIDRYNAAQMKSKTVAKAAPAPAAKTNGVMNKKVSYTACRHGSKDAADCLQCKAEAQRVASGPDQAASKGDIQKPIADLAALVAKAAVHVDKLRMEGNVIALVKTMDRVKTLIDQIKAVNGVVNELYDQIRIKILPSVMEDQDVTNIRVDGVGLCYLADDIQVSQSDKDAVIKWLTDHHFEDLVKESVNAQTLAAWVRRRLEIKDIKEADRYPKDLITVKPFTRAAIRTAG